MVNRSKINDLRFWKKWGASGAIGTGMGFYYDKAPRILAGMRRQSAREFPNLVSKTIDDRLTTAQFGNVIIMSDEESKKTNLIVEPYRNEKLSPVDKYCTGERRSQSLFASETGELPYRLIKNKVKYSPTGLREAEVVLPFTLMPTKEELYATAVHFAHFLSGLKDDKIIVRDGGYDGRQYLILTLSSKASLENVEYRVFRHTDSINIEPEDKAEDQKGILHKYAAQVSSADT